MAKLKLVDNKGKAAGDVTVSDGVFAVTPNEHLLYLARVRQEANARNSIANTKTRSEVRGGGAKPWKQKGTGRARAGSIRSPLWAGGGVIHGPSPEVNWTKGMNKKERRAALRSALSLQFANSCAIKDFGIKEGKTKEFASLVAGLGLEKETALFVVDSADKNYELVKRSASNMPTVKVVNENEINVKDLLKATKVVIAESAAKAIDVRLQEAALQEAA